MLTPQLSLPIHNELVVDLFAGGGGASTGIEAAIGRSVDIAINHDEAAIAMHTANHPQTKHYCSDIFEVDPLEASEGRPVGLLWASPSCTHFSKARGGTPVSKQLRSLGWVVVRWAARVRPRVIMLENVEEFCFPGETTVLSKRGMIPIAEIRIGDEVWTHNSRWKPVISVSKKQADTVRIYGVGNTIAESTANHRYYARQYASNITKSGKFGRHEIRLLEPDWVRADQLGVSDKSTVFSSQYSGYAWATPTTFPRYWMRLPHALGIDVNSPAFFYMIGRWLGDGWFKRRKNRGEAQSLVRICANLQKSDYFEAKLKETGLPWKKTCNHSKSVNVFDLSVQHSRILMPWLQSNFKEYAHLKTLPAWVFGATEAQRWALIEGYHDADGHERPGGRVRATSVSRCLAVGMKLLLQSLGVAASISSVEAKQLPGIGNKEKLMNCRKAYTVSWNRSNQWTKAIQKENHSFGRVNRVAMGRTNVDVYDITVADDHSFIADGQVVHNCDWGPVIKDKNKPGFYMPCKKRKGQLFALWVGHLRNIGYQVEWKILTASDYGAPTIRKRLFLVARCDGLPIEWPAVTHGNPKAKGYDSKKLKPWRTAAECIDWSIPCPSIFDRKKPLADSTLKRIAKGIVRYVIEAKEPFIVSLAHGEESPSGVKRWGSGVRDTKIPLQTVLASGNGAAIVTPIISSYYSHKSESGDSRNFSIGMLGKWRFGCTACSTRYGIYDYERNPICPKCGSTDCSDILDEIEIPYEGADEEELEALVAAHLSTQYGYKPDHADHDNPHTSSTEKCVQTEQTEVAEQNSRVASFLAKHYTGVLGQSLDKPTGTVTTVDHHAVVTAHMTKFNTGSTGFDLDTPMHTIIAGGQPKRPGTAITQGLVTSHMIKLRGDNVGSSADSPLHTITAGGTHAGEVRALLIKYYGNEKDGAPIDEPLHTVPTKDRFGLVIVHLNGEPYVIVDICMRMLQPHELYLAQGFPESYIHEFEFKGKPLTKSNQVKMVGNSVCPPIAQALVTKNYVDKQFMEMAA